MNTILCADPVNSPVFSLNTDTRCKGRPILVLWESGNSSEDEFGTQIMSQGTTPNAYRYTGQQSDADSGLLYLRARYYEPSTGRFISQDPKKGDLKDPASFNLYIYCKNNPIRYNDPTGLDRIDFYLIDKARPYDQKSMKIKLEDDVDEINFFYCKDSAVLKERLYESFKKADYVVIRSHSGSEGFGIPSHCPFIRAKILLTADDIIGLLTGASTGSPITVKRIIGEGCDSMLMSDRYNLVNAFNILGVNFIGSIGKKAFNDSSIVNFILSDILNGKPSGEALDCIINDTLNTNTINSKLFKGAYQRLK